MKKQKGFTLIELLVVIAIIGILSSVVLASLNTARGKGSNAAVKSNMANMRAQAQLFYDNNNGTFGTATPVAGLCTQAGSLFVDPVITAAIASITTAGGAPTCISTASTWAMSAPLKVAEGSNTNWCVDWNGASKGEPAGLGSGITTCP
jgi:prepilin-type N-terminal cleavage/methylation domain-containing protein